MLAIALMWNTGHSSKFEEKLRAIENARKELQDSLALITQRYNSREAELKGLIKQDLKLIDELSIDLSKRNASAVLIQDRIKKHKQEIDRLWAQQ
jgi:hypothetical protein